MSRNQRSWLSKAGELVMQFCAVVVVIAIVVLAVSCQIEACKALHPGAPTWACLATGGRR